MLLTEDNVRDNLRNRDGKRVFYLSHQDQLTSAARDYLRRERVEILPAEQAKQARYALLGGGFLTEKPEHMTHLDAETLVPKTHPRIQFRGRMDTLEAELILTQLALPEMTGELGQILDYTRKLLSFEVLNQAVEAVKLLGLDDKELRQHSHFPQQYYGQPHFMPSFSDGTGMAQLNHARCAAREAELAAVQAFTDADGRMTRPDLIRGMNRLSSALYILMIRRKEGRK